MALSFGSPSFMMASEYTRMAKALSDLTKKTGKQMLFSLCQWGRVSLWPLISLSAIH